MSTADAYRGALEAVERILNRGGEADDVLRDVASAIHARFPHYSSVGIYPMKGSDLVLRPCDRPQATERVQIPIAYHGRAVGEIHVDSDERAAFGPDDRAFLERVATLVSPYCVAGRAATKTA